MDTPISAAMNALIAALDEHDGFIPEPPDNQSDRILAAAVDAITAVGWGRLTMRDIASRARIGRATLYRHFPGKSQLRDALVIRQFGAFMREIGESRSADVTTEEAMLASMSYLLNYVRTNPLLARLRELDRDELLRITSDPNIIAAGATMSAQQWGTQIFGHAPIPGDALSGLRIAGEITCRLSLSLMASPDTMADFSTPDATRAFIRRHILPMMPLGPLPSD